MPPSLKTAAAFALVQGVALAQQYVISTYAGGAAPPSPIQGTSISIGTVWGMASDSAGNAYFSSTVLHSVFKLDSTGTVTRVAGNGRAGFSGDGGPATGAQLNNPDGVAVNSAGDLFIADYNNRRIREVTADGIIHTIAGNGACCFSGDGGPATSASLATPFSVAVDRAGNVFVADLYVQLIRRIGTDGTIRTIAGNGAPGFAGDGGPAILAQLNGPTGLAADSRGDLFIADCNNARVRVITRDGNINTVAGAGPMGISNGDGGPATAAHFNFVYDVALDGAGNLFAVDYGRVREVTSDGKITTVAGGGADWSASGAATSIAMIPYSITADPTGNLFVFDTFSGVILKVSNGNASKIAGNGSSCCYAGDGGPAATAQLTDPASVAVGANGNVYFTDAGNGRIRRVAADGSITTVGTACGWPDDVWAPCGLAVDAAGNFYVSGENGTAKISPDGTRKLLADHGVGIAVDPSGNLFIADQYNNLIIKIAPGGETTTLASGLLMLPTAIAVKAENIYVADSGNKRILVLSASGSITNVIDVSADLPDDLASVGIGSVLVGLAVDSHGIIFFEEMSSTGRRIRRIAADGTIATIAGTATAGYSGDGGPAVNAQLNPSANELGNTLAFDGAGNLYVADGANNSVRVLKPVNIERKISKDSTAASQIVTGPPNSPLRALR